MKTKEIEKIKEMSMKDLQSQVIAIKKEMAKTSLEGHVNQPKNSNLMSTKKQKVAVLLTVLNQKKVQKTV